MSGHQPQIRTLRSVLLLAGAVLIPGVTLSGEPEPAGGTTESMSLAHRFAPILWLAPDEPAYPMLPFPFAFDGIDNDEDGQYDLEDVDEVNALYVPKGQDKKKKLEELESLLLRLRELVVTLRDSPGDPKNAIKDEAKRLELLVEAGAKTPGHRTLDKFKLCEEFEGTVKCGPTAAVLFHLQSGVTAKELKARNLAHEPLSALQYWMYYPWDDEHLHDGEHVSVFFTPKRVEAVVGAGHIPSTANNILAHIIGLGHPSNIPKHMPILVELGKHSSAPDLNCNGAFDVGQDSNWLPTGAWGTRDINHANGKSVFTKYEPFHSFDRARGTMLVDSAASRSEYAASCSEHSLGGAVLRGMAFPQQPDHGQAYFSDARPQPDGLSEDRHFSIAYKLIDADALASLFKTKGPPACPPDVPDLKRRLFEMKDELFLADRHARWQSVDDVVLDPAFIARLEEFRTAGKNREARPDIWNHADYGTYGNDFKAGLFRRLSFGPSVTVENGNSRYGVYFRFAPRAKDSSLDLQVWVDRFPFDDPVRNENLPEQNPSTRFPLEAALLYNSFSTSYNGLYAGISVRSRDLRYSRLLVVPGNSGASSGEHVVIRTRQDVNAFIEAGYALGIPLDMIPLVKKMASKSYRLATRPLQLRVGVAGPLLWGTAPSNDDDTGGLRASRWPQAVELRLTLQIRLMNLGMHFRGHPLDKKP